MISGKTELAVIVTLSIVAVATDLLRGRIYNWLTLPAIAAALVWGAWQGGFSGLGSAALGMAAGFAFYGWMFALRVIGGGDVKLIMAYGAWGGWAFAEEVALLGIFIGGALAAITLVLKGRMPDFLARARRLVTSLLVRELELDVPQVDTKLTMPFGIPMAVAAVWGALAAPLQRLGVTPWP